MGRSGESLAGSPDKGRTVRASCPVGCEYQRNPLVLRLALRPGRRSPLIRHNCARPGNGPRRNSLTCKKTGPSLLIRPAKRDRSGIADGPVRPVGSTRPAAGLSLRRSCGVSNGDETSLLMITSHHPDGQPASPRPARSTGHRRILRDTIAVALTGNTTPRTPLLVDVAAVDLLGAAGITTLITGRNLTIAYGTTFHAVNAYGIVNRVLHLCDLNTLPIADPAADSPPRQPREKPTSRYAAP